MHVHPRAASGWPTSKRFKLCHRKSSLKQIQRPAFGKTNQNLQKVENDARAFCGTNVHSNFQIFSTDAFDSVKKEEEEKKKKKKKKEKKKKPIKFDHFSVFAVLP